MAGLVRFEASLQPGLSGTSGALESAIFKVALDSDEITDMADVIAVVKVAIFKSIESAGRLLKIFFPVLIKYAHMEGVFSPAIWSEKHE